MLVTLPLDIAGVISFNPDCPWRVFQSLIAERVIQLELQRDVLICSTFRIFSSGEVVVFLRFQLKVVFKSVWQIIIINLVKYNDDVVKLYYVILVLIFCCFCKLDYCVQVALESLISEVLYFVCFSILVNLFAPKSYIHTEDVSQILLTKCLIVASRPFSLFNLVLSNCICLLNVRFSSRIMPSYFAWVNR